MSKVSKKNRQADLAMARFWEWSDYKYELMLMGFGKGKVLHS